MMYKNQEGYADPTAGQALANIRREEKARLGYMPLVYILSLIHISEPTRH